MFHASGNVSAPKMKSIGGGFQWISHQILNFWKTSVKPQRESFKDRGQSLASTVHDRHFRELNAGLEVYFRAGRIMFVE